MNIKQYRFLLITLILTSSFKVFSWSNMYSFDKNLFVGNIIFPKTVAKIPQISLYTSGLKILTETENTSNKIQFTISEDNECKKFYLLITPYLQPHIEDNTVTCLKVPATQNYKLYELSFYITQDEKRTSSFASQPPSNTTNELFTWRTKEIKIKNNRAIPDNAIIIIFNPDYIEKLEGGNNLELPKIIIKENILDLAGSEKKLLDESNELLMASLDLNILHIKPTSKIKPDYKRKIVIAMSKN